MRRCILTGSTAIWLCMGLAAPLFAGTAQAVGVTTMSASAAEAAPAKACLGDLAAFQTMLDKNRYWRGGAGYGYPMMGLRPGAGGVVVSPSGARPGYTSVRPAYEVRTLISGANILAQHGQQAACATVLASARKIYKTYSAEMKNGHIPTGDASAYHAKQIASAVSVESLTRSIRSDELLGTDLRNTKDQALGSVDDLLMSPQSGKIAYLVISRGGVFGFDQKYVPIPWADFSITPDRNFLVLHATKDMLKAAPQVDHNQVMTPGEFATVSKAIDAYWAKTLPPKAGN